MELKPSPMEVHHHIRALPVLLLLLFVSPSPEAAASASDSGGEKVPVALYYETLCPYCANFIVNGLSEVFDNGLTSIVDLKLSPYGNAKIGANSTISCQHGPSECFLNTIEACVINAWPSVSEHFPLIHCIEKLVHEHDFTQWESCFDELGLDSKPVQDCYTSGLGTELELKYADETNALQPPHQYVPWVVVNGTPLYDDYENFMSYVCKAYSGTGVPKACSDLSRNAINLKNPVQKRRVCHNESTPFISRVTEAAASIMCWLNVVT